MATKMPPAKGKPAPAKPGDPKAPKTGKNGKPLPPWLQPKKGK